MSTSLLVEKKIDIWKSQLMDTTRRNRLLFFKETKTGSTQILNQDLEEIYNWLVKNERQMILLAKKKSEESEIEIKLSDLKKGELLINLNSKDIVRILYHMRLKANTALQERGVNILFITLGFLEWKEVYYSKTKVFSPLILVPVQLIHERSKNRFKLALQEEEIILNPTLVQILQNDYGLLLPSLSDVDLDNFKLNDYLKKVQKVIQNQDGWSVNYNSYLGLFSFSKLVMYKDLENYTEKLMAHPLVAAIAGDKSRLSKNPGDCITVEQMDDKVSPLETYQVLDADSSQQEAIMAAKTGISFVLHGPPGTGKSQTITNIIAECLADAKSVLFVSEKMAALEVVKTRLDQCDLGNFCLELHSHKTNKRVVVEELKRCYSSQFHERKNDAENELRKLVELRQQLNDYVKALHKPRSAQNITAYNVHGKLASLEKIPDLPLQISDVMQISREDLWDLESKIERLSALDEVLENYFEHPWYGIKELQYSLQLQAEIQEHFANFINLNYNLENKASEIASLSKLEKPNNINDIRDMAYILSTYSAEFLHFDIQELIKRFKTIYKSFLRVLKPGYWKDKKKIQQVSKTNQKMNYRKALGDLQFAKSVIDRIGLKKDLENIDTNIDEKLAQLLDIMSQINLKLEFLESVFLLNELRIGNRSVSNAFIKDVNKWLEHRLNNLGKLRDWLDFNFIKKECEENGLQNFVGCALEKKINADHLVYAFRKAFYRIWLDELYTTEKVLSQFNSKHHQTIIDNFRVLDVKQMNIARQRIKLKLAKQRPQIGMTMVASSEPGILMREASKKRRHKPIRKLFKEIPSLLRSLKPCLLMSPLSVSQFLDPELFEFDVIIFDEASQISPEDAISVIMRGKQIIVVGDNKQMPPTRFFSRMQMDNLDDEEELESLESILDECSTIGLTVKPLTWHYRSKHESLISFSNHKIYNGELNTFPSAYNANSNLGLEFIYVKNGIYDRGNRRINKNEACKIARLVFKHFNTTPDLSLGVIAFSKAQQMAILDEIERLRLDNPNYEQYFDENGKEPFFVKNLENVQGDERDVIFLSVGYGKDAAGKLTFNFGPLTKTGGYRRLNVAVTRARYHLKLVASILPIDLDAARSEKKEVKLLKSYLEFAYREGDVKVLLKENSVDSEVDFESPFEEEVWKALTEKGLILDKQVGCSGYRIDLAVKDPNKPGRYLLGIECDGAMYHSAKTARDRDRIRQNILENLDWRIHRIWSRDWINDPNLEVKKVLKTVELAKKTLESEDLAILRKQEIAISGQDIEASLEDKFVEITEIQEQSLSNFIPDGVEVYKRIEQNEVLDMILKSGDFVMAVYNISPFVVEREGPIERVAFYRTVADLLGKGRLGSKISNGINCGVKKAIKDGKFVERNGFFWPIGMIKPIVRIPSKGEKARDITEIAIEELAEGIILYMQCAFSISKEELITQIAKLFGYSRVGNKIKTRIEEAYNELIKAKRLKCEGKIVKIKSIEEEA